MNSRINKQCDGFTLIEVMVALSLLALTIAGLAQVCESAYRHAIVAQEIQQATYFADAHLKRLNSEKQSLNKARNGHYLRGSDAEPYPWQLSLRPLSPTVLAPHSKSLSNKVNALSADLSVWVDQGARELRFHTLLLLEPLNQEALNDKAAIKK